MSASSRVAWCIFGKFATRLNLSNDSFWCGQRRTKFRGGGWLRWLMELVVSSRGVTLYAGGSSSTPFGCELLIPQSARSGFDDGAICGFGVSFASVML